MRFVIWAVIITSFGAVATLAQKKCSMDSDCTGNQYCYEVSKICVNFVLCSQYNRKESSTPSRQARQCGACVEGYFGEKTLGGNSEDEICTTAGKKDYALVKIVQPIIAVIIALSGTLYAVYSAFRSKSPGKDEPAIEPENTSWPMVENANCATALLPTHSNQNLSESRCNDTEETNPSISTTRERTSNFVTVEESQPLKPRGFHLNPTSNPGDNQTAGTSLSPLNKNEETVPSEQIPSPPAGSTSMRPSIASAQAVEDNRADSAIQRLAGPSPSADWENEENIRNNSNS